MLNYLPISPLGHVLIVTGIEPVSRLDHDISIAAALAVILDGPCLGERPDTIRLRLPFRHTIKIAMVRVELTASPGLNLSGLPLPTLPSMFSVFSVETSPDHTSLLFFGTLLLWRLFCSSQKLDEHEGTQCIFLHVLSVVLL